MFIFFGEFGIPAWMAVSFILGLLICPIFSIAGIVYIFRRKYNAATFLLSGAALILSAVCFFLLFDSESTAQTRRDIFYYLFNLSFPFGFTVSVILAAWQSSSSNPAYSLLLPIIGGISANFLSIFGIAAFIQNIIKTRK